MRMDRFDSEQDLAGLVVAWLTEQHWDVYQEVSTGYSESRADIVAVQGPLSWIMEVKTCLSLDLMAQATDWLGRANFVSIAVPLAKNSRSRAFAGQILRDRGIGLIECDATAGVHQAKAPKLCRKVVRPIGEYLHEAQKTMAPAGSARGGYHTPFAATCLAVTRFVTSNPGCTMRELVDGIEHHYGCDGTARSCLNHWLGTAKIVGVERRHEDGQWRLFPVKVEGKR